MKCLACDESSKISDLLDMTPKNVKHTVRCMFSIRLWAHGPHSRDTRLVFLCLHYSKKMLNFFITRVIQKDMDLPSGQRTPAV